MARLTFKDIKRGDKFKANCSGLVWHVWRRSAKRKKITMWAKSDVLGCVEMEFTVGQINMEFIKI